MGHESVWCKECDAVTVGWSLSRASVRAFICERVESQVDKFSQSFKGWLEFESP